MHSSQRFQGRRRILMCCYLVATTLLVAQSQHLVRLPTAGIDVPEDQPKCFPLGWYFGYDDCCRLPGTLPKDVEEHCFDGDEYTYEKCCWFPFGPVIRGLPYYSLNASHHLVELVIEPAGRIVLELSAVIMGDNEPSDLGQTGEYLLTMRSWILAVVLSNMERILDYSKLMKAVSSHVFQDDRTDVEVDFVRSNDVILAKLIQFQARQLKVLDVGSGAGLAAIVAARAGHKVVAVDINEDVLGLLKRNAGSNHVDIEVCLWNAYAPPPIDILAYGRFDVVSVDFFAIIMHPDPPEWQWDEEVKRRSFALIRSLLKLEASLFVFFGWYRRQDISIDKWTSVLMDTLSWFGSSTEGASGDNVCGKGAGDLCPRLPFIFPYSWLEQTKLTPPTREVPILW